jgi:hypothetical protein
MNRMAIPVTVVGNEFVLPKPKIKVPESKVEMKVEASMPAVAVPAEEVSSKHHENNLGSFHNAPVSEPAGHLPRLLNFFHQHTFIVVSLAVLVIGSSAVKLAGNYWTAQHITLSTASTTVKTNVKPVSGFNMTVPAADLQAKLQTITGQPVTLTVGQYSERVDPNIVKSWLQVTANKQKSEYYIHVNEAAIGSSLVKEANTYSRAPINQVTVNEDGANVVAVAGQNGRGLSDPNGLKSQGQAAAKNVLGANGLQFNTPMAPVAFQSQTPANFSKLLVADVTSKKMWAFQNGQQVNSFLVSAGAPDTPTPLGEFHVYAKFSVQDMSGTNLNGTKYFQPQVPWVSYFYEGSAVHGVYWHPLSWFGAINSSHGCVGLPVDQAEWVYNWDSIGTTVIVNA